MKRILYILLTISIVFSACKKEDPEVVAPTVVNGCTDPNALNYDALANTDDGSCNYPPSFEVSGDAVISGSANEQLTSHLTVTNVSHKTLNVRCRINLISQPSGTLVTFCWAEVCYAEGTLVSINTVSMNSDQVVVFPDLPAHSGYYNANGDKNAIAEIEYCFYDDDNPTDETCFTVTFDPSL